MRTIRKESKGNIAKLNKFEECSPLLHAVTESIVPEFGLHCQHLTLYGYQASALCALRSPYEHPTNILR